MLGAEGHPTLVPISSPYILSSVNIPDSFSGYDLLCSAGSNQKFISSNTIFPTDVSQMTLYAHKQDMTAMADQHHLSLAPRIHIGVDLPLLNAI